MNNLGGYQWFTTTAKKVGGPWNLLAITAMAGYSSLRLFEIGGKKIVKIAKAHHRQKLKEKATVCNVTTNAHIEANVDVKTGDKIRVYAVDGTAVMIEILGHENNPYFIDMAQLKSITDYK